MTRNDSKILISFWLLVKNSQFFNMQLELIMVIFLTTIFALAKLFFKLSNGQASEKCFCASSLIRLHFFSFPTSLHKGAVLCDSGRCPRPLFEGCAIFISQLWFSLAVERRVQGITYYSKRYRKRRKQRDIFSKQFCF